MNQITNGGIGNVETEAKAALIREIAKAFAGGTALDRTLATWIDGRSESSSAFYTAMAAGSNSIEDGVMTRHLASLVMNKDLRCIRCHDAYIEGSGRQEDYWSFVSLLDRDLGLTNNVWSLRNDAVDRPLFYALVDGRQRVATPSVPQAWIASAGDRGQSNAHPVEAPTLAAWASQLPDSTMLAAGLVNSIWQMVYGQPLRGRVVDPMNAPHNESLAKLEAQLIDDLRRSNFDMGRTLALVIASPAGNRQVPSSLKNEWVIDNVKDRNAAEAFAAAMPPTSNLSLERRFEEAMRAIGLAIGPVEGADDSPLLAQVGDDEGVSKDSAGKVNGVRVGAPSDSLSWDFPDRAVSLPVEWLGSIKGVDQQVNHLAFLAGSTTVPVAVDDAVKAMEAANVDATTLLNRVWWMVRSNR